MYLSDLSVTLNIPIIAIRSFLESYQIHIDSNINLSEEVERLVVENAEQIRSNLKIENIKPPDIPGIKIINKIDLSTLQNINKNKPRTEINESESESIAGQWQVSNDKEILMPTNRLPRLLAATKEFNISQDTLVEYLVSIGFDRDDIKPTSKLTEEMYMALKDSFQSDKEDSIKKANIILPPKSYQEQNRWKGVVDTDQNEERVKINFIRYERSYKNGRLITIEKPDSTRWLFAYKSDWSKYIFTPGNKIFFSIHTKEKEGNKIRIAIPPLAIVNVAEEQQDPNYKHLDATEERINILEKETNTKPIAETIKHTPDMYLKTSPLQKILFGSPGTGKSYQIVDAEDSYFNQLTIESQKADLIKTVFHPEYTYGDFMGKLMPLTNRGKVEYRYYSGHFMFALGTAYKNIIKAYIEYINRVDEIERDFKSEKRKNKSDYSDEEKIELQKRIADIKKPKPKNVLLVIDEINRGNSAAIFGTVFQLLDRDNSGWSSYPVQISDLELQELLNVTGLYYVKEGSEDEVGAKFCSKKILKKEYDDYVQAIFNDLEETKRINILDNNIKMPPNLSIIATMNTSDNSIYFMDSAFKRRWDWEFIDITSEAQKRKQSGRKMEDGYSWDEFVDNLNEFIKKYGERIRKIEDKQIGYYFIKGDVILNESIKNKLMFFLWDSIFNNDKKPIRELIGQDKTLVTFGDFIKESDKFIQAIKNKSF